MAVDSTFTTLDPYDSNDTLSQAVSKSFYQGLFGFDKDMKLVNVLATGYEASPDAKVYTIRLRQGVKFQDGTDFNAAAVKANFDRVTDPANKLKRYNLFRRIAKTEVVDPYTAKITLTEPFSAFINVLAHPSAVMISPAALKKYGREIGLHPVGTGPFELVEWKQTDDLKVKKFAGYWKAGYPKIDAIDWKPVVDNNTRAALMKTGEADFAFRIPFEQTAELKASPKVDVIERASIIQRYVSLNVMQKPFDNPKVRQALNYAVNKEALAKVAFAGNATPATGIVPQGVDYAVKLGPWPYDPAKARAAQGGGLPERLRDDALVRVQQLDVAEGDPVRPAAARAGRREGAGAGARGGRAGREGRARRTRRRRPCGCTTSAGPRRRASRTGRSRRCSRRRRFRRSS